MIAQTATKVRGILSDFSGTLSAGLSKPARRFVSEALYGIMARQSVRLTEIGRALEVSIPLAKTETRLSRNLGRPELRAHLEAAVLKQGSRRIGKRTLLILDISDITKPYAKKMECLAPVRDGSTGEIANGYWLCQVIGVENEGNEITPLYGALYSQRAADFVSENEEIKIAIAKVSTACGGRGVWVIDRGELYSPLLAEGRAFIIRQKGDRHILFRGRKAETAALAADCPMAYATHIVREEQGKEVPCRLDYGFRPVRLPEHPDVALWLVVVRGLGAQPLMLLTTLPIAQEAQGPVVGGLCLSHALAHRGNHPLHQAELRPRGYPGDDLRPAAQHGRPGQRRRLLHRRRAGDQGQAPHPRHPPAHGGKAAVRRPRLPILRPGRRHRRGLREKTSAITTRNRPGHPRAQLGPAVEFFGESPG